MRTIVLILLLSFANFASAKTTFKFGDVGFLGRVVSSTPEASPEGTPVDILIIPTGTEGVLLTTNEFSSWMIGETNGWNVSYVDSRTPTHSFVTNAVYSTRTPFRVISTGTLYSNNTHNLLFDTSHTNATVNEGFVITPPPGFTNGNLSVMFRVKLNGTGNHNFDIPHVQSGNYAVAQLQLASGTLRYVTHNEPSTSGSVSGLNTNVSYNAHVRMNVEEQMVEVVVVNAVTGEVLGGISKTNINNNYGNLLYIKVQDYLWNPEISTDIKLEVSFIVINHSTGLFPLEPIEIPTPTNLYVVQTDTNTIRFTWSGFGVNTKVERNADSAGWTTLDDSFVTATTIGENAREYTDTNVVEGSSYQYRVTAQIGDYSSTASTSDSVLVTNSHPGFDVIWQQETNYYQTLARDTAAIYPAVLQQLKGIHDEAVSISRIDLNHINYDSATITNGEKIQVSLYSDTNRTIHYGTSRGTVISTNTNYLAYVFFTPAVIPAGTNVWVNVEGNWAKIDLGTAGDFAGYFPEEGFDILYRPNAVSDYTNSLAGIIGDLNFKIYIRHVPLVPTSVVATQTKDTEVSLTWEDANDGLTRYKIDQYHGSWSDNITNVSGTNVTITGLSIGETYKWRVYSYIDGEIGSDSSKAETSEVTMEDMPVTTNTFVTGYTGVSSVDVAAGAQYGIRLVVGANDVVVTDVGAWMRSGTYADFAVLIKNSACTVLSSNVVPVAGKVDDAFNWAPPLSSPLTLTNGQTYYISRTDGGAAFNSFAAGTMATTEAGTQSGGYDAACALTGGGTQNGGVNFKYYEP